MDSKLYDYHKPDFRPGKYQLTVELKDNITTKNKKVEHFTNNGTETTCQEFIVSGQRFNLPAINFNACYPPESGKGDFSNCLPNLAMNKSTLPWEWDLPFTIPDAMLPWMALLLFHEDEIPKLQPIKIGDLKNEWKADNSFTMDEELNGDALYIELKGSLFEKIAPKSTELPYLFHVKETGDEKFAIAVCNRLPKNGRNEVHLVSLLGWDGKTVTDSIKLASLKKWSFESKEEHRGNLSALMSTLTVGSVKNKAYYGSKELSQSLQNLLTLKGEQNISLVPFKSISGEKISAWYRGPFLPFEKVNSRNKYVLGATQLDRESLNNNLSYAAAWQLGQLLALKDQVFIQNLQSWKYTVMSAADGKTSGNQIASVLKNLSETSLLNSTPTESPIAETTDSNPVEEFILSWLKDLSILRGIPFYYLIPSTQILGRSGAGELAFFYLDHEWIENIISGALSFLFMGSRQASPLLVQQANRLLERLEYSTVSGFILQSTVVNDWPDLVVEVLDNESANKILRKDKLNNDVLLGLYEGNFDYISFAEPFHNLHFGFENDGTRKIGKGIVTQKFRDKDGRVLNIDALSTDIAKEIAPQKMSPGVLATNMIDRADKIIYRK